MHSEKKNFRQMRKLLCCYLFIYADMLFISNLLDCNTGMLFISILLDCTAKFCL